MKLRSLTLAALLLSTLLAPLANAAIETVDRVIAVVNRGVITQDELDDRIASVKQNLTNQKIQAPPEDVLKQQVLERMITDLLQVQYANAMGIKADDATLDRAVNRIAEQNKMSLPQFRATLEKQGMTWKGFREDIRREMVMGRLKEREIDSKVVITDSEVDDYIKLNAGKTKVEYKLQHILISVPENASPEQIQQRRLRAQTAKQEIMSGADFSAIAAKFSTAPDATSGGQLGWRPAGSLPQAFTELLDKLPVGSTTEIIRSPAGFHLMKLLDKREQNPKEIVTQTHARHILIKTNELVSETDARQKLVQLRDRIVNGGAKFEDMARAYSDDTSASKGGDLGWVNPGETVPEFEQAMNALQPNQVSQPVHSPFGYHLIQVLERRQQDVTQERERFRVRQELKQRKAEEQYEDWLRQQRDRAYVDIRLKEE
ncbi:peptidylprolyl isomerase [Jeongeupia naejangsanensis]|uniref:Chaperone SurA n=1 Tax=Jeongeupia naejangsanensis TaxID=613195 RepID=A0ABS2BQZ4_9NEIS|nr:peptidylprolyl isomerase [Jeongeupia naejangsanensis]MBM3117214.1 peptidylprolyl isomerase [Jeongeupia naejangsanensis]